MALLKKIKSATLVEALIATVLIVIIFMTASLVINNLLLNNFTKSTHQVETRLNELEYQIQNGNIELPYQEIFQEWEISAKKESVANLPEIDLVATYKNRTVLKKRIDVEE